MFDCLFHSVIKRARDQGKISVKFVNIRDFASDKYKTVDDRPFGGGVGMILKVDVIDRALSFARSQIPLNHTVRSILVDPRGKLYSQTETRDLVRFDDIIIVTGHYEGIDARSYQLVDEVYSLGNFIVTGGELPAMIVVDSVTRLVPAVLKPEATADESFNDASYAPPQYTRPQEYKGMRVPDVLLSGNHREIKAWNKSHQNLINKK